MTAQFLSGLFLFVLKVLSKIKKVMIFSLFYFFYE
nr:MAG TPA: hypothetical protein [Caudoviricetes sp.]